MMRSVSDVLKTDSEGYESIGRGMQFNIRNEKSGREEEEEICVRFKQKHKQGTRTSILPNRLSHNTL